MPGLNLTATLGLDGNGFAAGFRKAKGAAEGASEGIKHLVIGAIGVGTLEEALRRTVETAKDLVDTSERLAIAPEQLQVLRQAAKNSNVEFEKLAETFEKVDIARQKALIPGKEGQDARRAFSALGIGTGQLRTDTAAQLFTGPLRQAALNRNPEELGVIFRELGIKAFGRLIPLLKTDFDELGQTMKRLGAIMDTETALKLKALSNQFSYLGQLIAVRLGPALISLTRILIESFIGLKSAWVYLRELFSDSSAKRLQETMSSTPGFAGQTDEQKARGIPEQESKFERDVRKAEAYQAAKASAFESIDWLNKLEKSFQQAAQELDNPKPPNLAGSVLPPKMNKKSLETPTNSLLRIGNFLGSRSAFAQIEQRKVQLLQIIATNTKPQRAPRQSNFTGDAEPTFYPIA